MWNLLRILLAGLLASSLLTNISYAHRRPVHHNRLTVCAIADYPPLSMYRHHKLQGMEIDQVELMAKDLHMRPRFIKIQRNDLANAMQQHQCDLAIGGIVANAKISDQFLITMPVHTVEKVGLVRCLDKKKLQQLTTLNSPGIRIVANYKSPNYRFAKRDLNQTNLMTVTNNNTAFWKLLQNKADVMIISNIQASYQQHLMRELCQIPLTPNDGNHYMVYVLPKGKTELLNKINAWLEKSN